MEESTEQNSLLNTHGLPQFEQFDVEQVVPAVKKLINESRAAIEQLLEGKNLGWQDVVEHLEEVDDHLSKAWAPVSHLNAVMNSDELREAYNNCLPLLTEYGNEVGQNKALYEAYQQLKSGSDYQGFNRAQKKVIDDALLSFHLSGVDLNEQDKERFRKLSKKLSECTSKYSENVLDATDSWQLLIGDSNELPGLPETALAAAQQAAVEKGKSGYLLTLDIPSYLPVMSYCENRELRKTMYRAFVTRASDLAEGGAQKWDNSALMVEILQLRQQLAQLLGFNHYAERSLAKKMADSVDEIVNFLAELSEKALPAAKAEFAELEKFSSESLGLAALEAWDVAYASDQLQQQRYAFSQEQLRPYFPVDKVISGLFSITEKLFQVSIKENAEVERWHPDVKYYEVLDAQLNTIAGFYLDLFARNKKRGGAWMDECRVRRRLENGQMQLPIAYLTCNFNGPVGGVPALLTHDEVTTLFHEFGHGLHHMLTQIEYGAVSGINGVPWDAVELPSQFLENWCWEKEAIPYFSAHYESGEPLPENLLDSMLAARNFHSAMQLVRQIEFSLFDMKIHADLGIDSADKIHDALEQIRQEVAVVKPPEFNRFENSFGHIFAGGYAAGYFSYKWAEVLSADAFSRFEEEGIFNPQTGLSFKQEILEQGGSAPAMELFESFRGRKPSVEALLRHSGIV